MGPEFEPGGDYTASPFYYQRRKTREVMVGSVGVGGNNPIRVQSMTVAPTLDTEATVNEAIQLFEAGCEIVRITAQGPKEARNLEPIREALKSRGFDGPLVADIHFSPRAALTAVEYVEKVRINPGNFADTKMFAVREYTDEEYQKELERIHDSFKPLVLRAAELGRAMRIGVNHGSLSDRIMNRLGDTPRGMVESALEFIKIAELYNFKDIIVSMKASNPQVMIQAYRMLVERFRLENMDYPLHLGVTEAGDGKDGRMKSACGIGALLEDGLGDTIRVSLTEDAVKEVPVARALADLYNRFAQDSGAAFQKSWQEQIHLLEKAGLADAVSGLRCKSLANPYQTIRRKTDTAGQNGAATPVAALQDAAKDGGAVLQDGTEDGSAVLQSDRAALAAAVLPFGGMHPIRAGIYLSAQQTLPENLEGIDFIVAEQPHSFPAPEGVIVYGISIREGTLDGESRPNASQEAVLSIPLKEAAFSSEAWNGPIMLSVEGEGDLVHLEAALRWAESSRPAFIALKCKDPVSPTHCYRLVAEMLEAMGKRLPLVLFSSAHGPSLSQSVSQSEAANQEVAEYAVLYRTSIHTGGLLLEGIGDGILVESTDAGSAAGLALDLLQTTRIRLYRTEYISCPSCGRTLFDLQETTARIKSVTGHLKGVKIAVMGCIVNGPGEMADADFGYVGSAPGKINLYRGKEVVLKNIPSEQADQALIDLIKEHGMWQDP
ncbi:MAG: 4-hydroxy-3-methylbut-2-en-1-yl diphosphate synthase [Spirochaetaceae bacterium]|nr:4-hydroxy-3-methylbut-2-en-1-yl diphosphate synthase [Spirochaetaceae bacterium]